MMMREATHDKSLIRRIARDHRAFPRESILLAIIRVDTRDIVVYLEI